MKITTEKLSLDYHQSEEYKQTAYMENYYSFTIYRARDAFLLHCLRQPNARRYRLYLNNIKLYAKMIDVQPALNVTIHGALEKQPATYAVRKTEVKAQFISAGRTEFDYNCFSSTIPRRITIALIEHAAFDGCPFSI